MKPHLQLIDDGKQRQLAGIAFGRRDTERLQLLVDFIMADGEHFPGFADFEILRAPGGMGTLQTGVFAGAVR